MHNPYEFIKLLQTLFDACNALEIQLAEKRKEGKLKDNEVVSTLLISMAERVENVLGYFSADNSDEKKEDEALDATLNGLAAVIVFSLALLIRAPKTLSGPATISFKEVKD